MITIETLSNEETMYLLGYGIYSEYKDSYRGETIMINESFIVSIEKTELDIEYTPTVKFFEKRTIFGVKKEPYTSIDCIAIIDGAKITMHDGKEYFCAMRSLPDQFQVKDQQPQK